MEEVEKSSYDGTDDNLDEVEDVGKISGELYDVLSQYCTGEALGVAVFFPCFCRTATP